MTCVVCQKTQFTKLFPRPQGRYMGRCTTCGLVQIVPMPSSRDIAALYHEDLDHFAPYIDQLEVHRIYFKEKINDILLRFRGLRITNNGLRLLDIGCAMGALLAEAARQGIEATGIDISNDAVAYCRKKGLAAYAGTIDRVTPLRPPLSKQFDVITAFQVIEHERNPLGFMRRVYKLLNNDGMVILATPDHGGIWRKIMGKYWVGYTHPEHVVLLDFNSMRTLLTKAGFRDIQIRSDSPRPFPLSFAFKRAADYFPWFSRILKLLGNFLDRFNLINPINPWDDMIVYARK